MKLKNITEFDRRIFETGNCESKIVGYLKPGEEVEVDMNMIYQPPTMLMQLEDGRGWVEWYVTEVAAFLLHRTDSPTIITLPPIPGGEGLPGGAPPQETPPHGGPLPPVRQKRVVITAWRLNVRQQPNDRSKIIDHVGLKSEFELLDEQNSWGKIKTSKGEGWISLAYTETI